MQVGVGYTIKHAAAELGACTAHICRDCTVSDVCIAYSCATSNGESSQADVGPVHSCVTFHMRDDLAV